MLLPACNKQEEIGNQQNKNNTQDFNGNYHLRSTSDMISSLSEVGNLHNEGLDFVYQKIYDAINGTSLHPGNEEMFFMLADGITEFIGTKFELCSDANFDSLKNYSNNYMQEIIFQASYYTPDLFRLHAGYDCSPELMAALDNMLMIGRLPSLLYSDKIYMWDQMLEERLLTINSEIEQMALIAAINTAKSSYVYWMDSDNYQKWIHVMNIHNEESVAARNAFWESDAIGAANGLIRGAIIGFCATGPGGALAGGVGYAVVGGVSASATFACFNVFFNAVGWL